MDRSFFLVFPRFSLPAEIDYFELGLQNYRAENYEEAYEFLKKARELHPQSSLIAFYLGLTLKQLGEFKEAGREFERSIELKPPVLDAYIELIDVFSNLGEYKKAYEYIEKAEKLQIKPAQLAFLKGIVLAKMGRSAEAISSFELAKSLDKNLEQPANLQIAMIHLNERKFKSALNAMRATISISPQTELAEFAREYERALENLLKGHKAFRGYFSTAYQFDDNAIGADGTIISRRSDKSLSSNLRLEYQPYLETPLYFNTQLNLSTAYYDQFDNLNSKAISLQITPGYDLKRAFFTIPLSYTRNWLDEKEYSETYTLRPSLNVALTNGHILQASAGYSRYKMLRRYPWQPKDESRTSHTYLFSGGYLKTFLEGKGFFNLRYEYVKSNTEGKNWENRGDRVSAQLSFPIEKRVRISFFGEAFLQRYNFVHNIFGKKRKDNLYTLGTSLSINVWKSLNFNLQHIYIRNDSNLQVYDYKREIGSFGFEFSF